MERSTNRQKKYIKVWEDVFDEGAQLFYSLLNNSKINMKRITVIMPQQVYDKVIELAKKEKRSKSAMAAILIEDGLKLINAKTL